MKKKKMIRLIWIFILFIMAAVCIGAIKGCDLLFSEKDEKLEIEVYEIPIPGISKSYEFLFLTDSHVIIPNPSDPEREKEYTLKRQSFFQGEDGSSSADCFSEWVDYVNKLKPDALLLGGDIIDFPSDLNLAFLENKLSLLKIPYLYTPGNHDWTYPWEYMTQTGREEYLPMLSPYMDGNPSIHYKDFGDFVIVAVNNSDNQIDSSVMEEYKEILSKKKPVILMLHVPLYTQELLAKTSKVWKDGVVLGGGIHGGIYPNEISAEFIRMTTAKDSPVAFILAGHVHSFDSSMVEGEKQILQIVGDAAYKGKGTLIRIKK